MLIEGRSISFKENLSSPMTNNPHEALSGTESASAIFQSEIQMSTIDKAGAIKSVAAITSSTVLDCPLSPFEEKRQSRLYLWLKKTV